MNTLNLLLLTVLPALVLACLAGLIIGKYQVKKAQGQLKSVLTPKQRMVVTASVSIGVACILLGIFLPSGENQAGEMDGWYMGEMDDDAHWADNGWENPGFEDEMAYRPDEDGMGGWPIEDDQADWLFEGDTVGGHYDQEYPDDELDYIPDAAPPSPGSSASASSGSSGSGAVVVRPAPAPAVPVG
ncbi:MAG: hypothetical protein FWE32_09540 [Oscillospiraceae bacterium]|nr:hypothetical protein [Oscillospiraceae bacterium]